MCGIFGYYNFKVKRSRKAILELLFTGLRRLEYRGYDSAGISIDADPFPPTAALDNGLSNGHCNGYTNGDSHSLEKTPSLPLDASPLVLKAQGKIDTLVTLAHEELCQRQVSLDTVLNHHAAIAHTRWATHGPPSVVNSHPHVSDDTHEFVVVHNGIITNFKVLKDFLVGPSVVPRDKCVIALLAPSSLRSGAKRLSCRTLLGSKPTKVQKPNQKLPGVVQHCIAVSSTW